MPQQELSDQDMLRIAADNAMRLEGVLLRQQPAVTGEFACPQELDGAIGALRELAQLLEKESSLK